MGPYSHQLEGIASYRSEISLLRRRIELLETELRILAIDTRLQAWARGIADHEAKIKRHQDLIGRIQADIAAAETERVALTEHKADLEASLQ
jgi:chromosome segregation ATPase